MSYGNGGYNRQGGGYGQGSNPYAQQDDSYDHSGYNGGGYGRQGDLEMQNMPLTSGNAGYRDGDVILNACKDIDQAIGGLESQLEQLKRLYRAAMENPEGNKRQVDELSSEIMSNYRELVNRLKKVKSQPESQNGRNSGQVGRVDRKLKAAIQSYQNMERDYRKSMQEQAGRQFKIVKPDATPEEVRQATENPDAPIFQQALMQSNRHGQATSVLNNVRARHEEILRIEQQMIELAQLFQDLDQIVMEQEPMVQNIEMKAEEAQDNVVKANVEMDHAITSARAARRKKWWCVLLAIIILVVIAIIIAVVVTILNKK